LQRHFRYSEYEKRQRADDQSTEADIPWYLTKHIAELGQERDKGLPWANKESYKQTSHETLGVSYCGFQECSRRSNETSNPTALEPSLKWL
jgi:hypothetical protein